MNENDLFHAVGGVATVRDGGDVSNPDDLTWNFGILGQPRPTLHRTLADAAPHLMGTWDGKSNVCLWENEIKLLGRLLAAQRQNRGTCTSRGTSAAANRRQIIQILTGQRQDIFSPVSHSFLYGAGKKQGNDLNSRDGAVGGWLYEAMRSDGLVTQAEAGDRYDDDAIAVKWGTQGPPSKMYELASDNRCDVVRCDGFVQAADALSSGHLVVVCSDQGFTMERDEEGFCSPRGTWMHCMHFIGVLVSGRGRRGLVCAQSWGENVPSGPTPFGMPSYSFGVDERVADRMLRQGDSAIVASVNGWPNLNPQIPWIFN